MRSRTVFVQLAAALAAAGCATSPYPPEPGPRVRPNDTEWRRASVPLPPLYMEFTSGSGNQWTMATPLYWQVVGAESESYHLLPLAGYKVDRAAGVSRGHILNYWWGDRGERSYRIGFPLYWSFRKPGAQTDVYGPVYRSVEQATERRRLIVLPWLFSRETDGTGYSYWGVLFRLLGYEKQSFGSDPSDHKERLWFLFAFHIDTV